MLVRQNGSILFEGLDGGLYEACLDGRWEVREVDYVETGSLIYPPACRSCGFDEPACVHGYCRDCHTDVIGCFQTIEG